ncbi:MAG: DUF2784 domain-containing protein [Desulfarculus sp.]|nr:DUF2784 domain-containing protein [Desulfarculus sp.]
MNQRLLADLVMLVHFAWIVFILAGLPLARRRPWLAWPHLGSLLVVLVLNLGGWYCPLTLLEYWLRSQDPAAPAYSGSFLFVYVDRLVYLRLPEIWLRLAGGAWAALNLLGYAWLWRRRQARRSGPA